MPNKQRVAGGCDVDTVSARPSLYLLGALLLESGHHIERKPGLYAEIVHEGSR